MLAADCKMSSSSGVFGIVVTETFPSEAEKAKFIAAFKDLADYIRREEPQTLMYQLLVADDDPLKTVLVERYQLICLIMVQP